jgi:hypothetical protein
LVENVQTGSSKKQIDEKIILNQAFSVVTGKIKLSQEGPGENDLLSKYFTKSTLHGDLSMRLVEVVIYDAEPGSQDGLS